MTNESIEEKNKLLKLVLDAIEQDKLLREQYQIGDKFKFIRDRLQALREHVQAALESHQQEVESKADRLAEDEMLVYVYLFNAQGLTFPTWQKMLSPSVFYEYSVNRPIYTDKNQIESFIRSKPNKALHGFLTIAVKKQDVLAPPVGSEPPKDPIGNPLIKIKEGALSLKRMFAFTHQTNDYVLNSLGAVVKKESE